MQPEWNPLEHILLKSNYRLICVVNTLVTGEYASGECKIVWQFARVVWSGVVHSLVGSADNEGLDGRVGSGQSPHSRPCAKYSILVSSWLVSRPTEYWLW